eukprot:6197957-Heterocapsa_arctica.AAC.1
MKAAFDDKVDKTPSVAGKTDRKRKAADSVNPKDRPLPDADIRDANLEAWNSEMANLLTGLEYAEAQALRAEAD